MERNEAASVIQRFLTCRDICRDDCCGHCETCRYNTEYDEKTEALKLAIEALGKDTNVPSKWIPVSERLPEQYCECLATYETVDGRKFLDILEYEPSYEYDYENHRFKGDWLFYDDDSRFTDGKVVAWMALPEPYKEGE